jgi:ABC-2 type transport system ATP-binding protein
VTTPAVSVRQLGRDFKTVRALDDVSFDVPPGVVFGFLGPNGAGKTTLIRVLLGLVAPSTGAARVFGIDPARHGDDVRRRCGALLEHHGLYERLTARQNLDFFARAWRLPPPERSARTGELLARFGLADRQHEKVGTWSRGMKQKLAIARSLLHRPDLVFLDEPTAGLDPVASAALREDLARLAADERVTVFLTTHNLAEAEQLCALVGVIRRGRLVAMGSPRQLRERQGQHVVRIRAAGLTDDVVGALGAHVGVQDVTRDPEGLRVRLVEGARPAALVRTLVEAGVDIDEVHREQASFEAAFLGLVDEGGPA